MQVEIYGKQNCSFCNAAKELLTEKAIPFDYLDIEKDPKNRADMFTRAPEGIRSVPQIFVDGEYVGGYTDLRAKLNGMPI